MRTRQPNMHQQHHLCKNRFPRQNIRSEFAKYMQLGFCRAPAGEEEWTRHTAPPPPLDVLQKAGRVQENRWSSRHSSANLPPQRCKLAPFCYNTNMARRAACNALLLLLLVAVHLTLLRGIAAATAVAEPSEPVVVATLLRTIDDVLPARVLMRSVLVHTAAPQTAVQRVVFALPGAVPAEAARQLSADGLEVKNLDFVPIPRLGAGVGAGAGAPAAASLTYTQLFAQTQFGRVVYLAPETLVKHDVAALAACPVFCAPFVSPCSFSTGVMVIQPNQTFYRDLIQAWPSHTCSHSANDNPDGLDEEACALNELLGMRLLNAPLFSLESSTAQNMLLQSNASAEFLERGPMMRLPMGCQAPHVLYYPRLRFEIPVQPCGQLRVIDFAGPSVMQPWRWWTYSVMDLSWDWQKYRMQLHDRNSPRDGSRFSVWVRIIAFQIAALVIAGLWNPCRADPARSAAVADPVSSLPLAKHGGPDEQAFLVIAVGRGLFALFLSGVIAFSLTPDTLLPLDALALFATYKCSAAVVLLIWHGRYCAAQALPSDVDEFPAPSSARAVWETVGWVFVDTIMLILVFVFVNLWPVGSGYTRLVMLAPFGFTYVFGLVFGLARVCMLWLAWGGGPPGDRSVLMRSPERRQVGASFAH
jgi:hypothetical protein